MRPFLAAASRLGVPLLVHAVRTSEELAGLLEMNELDLGDLVEDDVECE